MNKFNYLIKIFFILTIITSSINAIAAIKLGTGYSSLISGRKDLAIYGSLDSANFSMTASSVGFTHQYGYFAGHNLAILKNFSSRFFEAGVGLGITYVEAGYKSIGASETDRGHEISYGPAIKAFFRPFNFLFIGFQGTFGVGGPTLYGLALEDNINFLIGFEL